MWEFTLRNEDLRDEASRTNVERDLKGFQAEVLAHLSGIDELLGKFVSSARDPLLCQFLDYYHSDCTTPVPAGRTSFTLTLDGKSLVVEHSYCHSHKENKRVDQFRIHVSTPGAHMSGYNHLAEHLFEIASSSRRMATTPFFTES